MRCLIYNNILIIYLGVDCGRPPSVSNTIPVPTNLSLKLGDQYTYSCLPGHKPASNLEMTTTCQEDGTLSITPPICTCMYCS